MKHTPTLAQLLDEANPQNSHLSITDRASEILALIRSRSYPKHSPREILAEIRANKHKEITPDEA